MASAIGAVRASKATQAVKLALARREHPGPLGRRDVEVLAAARSLADSNPLLFANRWGSHIKSTFLSQRLKRIVDTAAVPHGFRASFRK